MLRYIPLIMILWAATAWAKPFQGSELTVLAKNYLALRANEEEINTIVISALTPRNRLYSSYARIAGQVKNIDNDSLFQVGSLTKSFIAVIILQLEADNNNHFSIEQSITHFFPQYKNWQNVSIKNLLNMTSGIPDFLDDENFFQALSQHPYQAQHIAQWLNRMHEKKLLFNPGQKFNYSNSNYFILGLLIEKITGRSLQFEIQNRLIKPLKLKNTFYVDDKIEKKLQTRMVHGYQFQSEYARFIPLRTDVTAYNMSYAGPSAGIISTSLDVMRWVKALFTPGKVLNLHALKKLTTLVSEKTGKEIQALSREDPQGFGLGIRALYYPFSKNGQAYAYEGLTLGYRAIYLYSPVDHIMVATTVNSNYHQENNYLFQLVTTVFKKIAFDKLA